MNSTRREILRTPVACGLAALAGAGLARGGNQGAAPGGKRALAIFGDAWHCVAPLDQYLVAKLRTSGYVPVTIMDYNVPFDEFGKFDLIVMSRYGNDDVTFYRERDVDPSKKKRTPWLTAAQEQKFEDYVNGGGRLFFHHDGFTQYPKGRAISRLAKAVFIKHPPAASCQVKPTDKMPMLTRGLQPFTITDEEFQVEMDESQTSVYLEGHSPQNGRTAQAWAHPYGKGKVAVFIPGHDRAVLSHEMVQRGIQNVIDWLKE
ncbi:MAG: ThuA domain-containing protein [Acidobacteria bacterium]|nr:ThuA domain-containing protein [Acidobacteriota bacterium]